MTKICSKCKIEKEINFFNKRKAMRDGHRSECRECQSLYITSEFGKSLARKSYHKNKNNPGRKEKRNKRRNERYKFDTIFNLVTKLRRRIWDALHDRKISKSNKTIKLLGCNYEEYKKHIESKFSKDMSWDKVFTGEIHIDHIIPISSFNLLLLEEQEKAFHYTNLQPLWAKENLSKGKKII